MKYKAILLTCVTCMAFAMTLSAMKYLQIKHAIESANSRPEVSESIEVHLVKNQNWQEQTTITGKVVVQNRIDLVSETAGRIEYIGFESGDSVEKGQILLRIDATQDIARRDAIVSEARLAEIALERIERLFKTGGASLEDLDEHRAPGPHVGDQYGAPKTRVREHYGAPAERLGEQNGTPETRVGEHDPNTST